VEAPGCAQETQVSAHPLLSCAPLYGPRSSFPVLRRPPSVPALWKNQGYTCEMRHALQPFETLEIQINPKVCKAACACVDTLLAYCCWLCPCVVSQALYPSLFATAFLLFLSFALRLDNGAIPLDPVK